MSVVLFIHEPHETIYIFFSQLQDILNIKVNWCLEVTNPQMKSETPIAIRATPYFWHEKHMKTLQARQVDLLQLRPSIGRFGPSHGRLVA